MGHPVFKLKFTSFLHFFNAWVAPYMGRLVSFVLDPLGTVPFLSFVILVFLRVVLFYVTMYKIIETQ